MPREPNAVDFWRGFALITIFIDHIPGLIYAHYTLANFSISDAADLFVFLAGWSLRLMAEGGGRIMPTRNVMLRLGGRSLEIYAAQVLITMLALGMLAASAIGLSNPLLLQWHNAAAVFNDPVPAHIGLVVLTHQLGYFDILPLYVVLMLMAPLFALIDRVAPQWLLPLSLGFYVIVLAFRLTLPTWPVPGTWYFNPLAWQAVFVLGFVLAKSDAGPGAFARRHIASIRCVGVPILILALLVRRFDWWPDPTKVPDPKLFFIADKTFVSPMRLIQFLALVAVFSIAFSYIRKAADVAMLRRPVLALIGLFAMLGRNSLHVFCIGSLLSLSAQIARFYYRGTVWIDTAVVVFGIVVMAFTAWLTEARQRFTPPVPAR
ncbi:MAG: OpgC family protein [Acidobacteriota bacterium]|jgi:hypothetical protein